MVASPDVPDRAGLRVQAYATDDIAPQNRHPAWQGESPASHVEMFEMIAEPGFSSQSASYEIGPLLVNFGTFGALRVVRDAERIRADGVDRLGVCLILEGEFNVRAPSLRASEGAVLLYDFSKPWEHFSTRCEIVTLALTRDLAVANGLDPAVLHGTMILPAHAGMLCHHLVQIRNRAPILSDEDGPRLARSIVDLIVVALGIAGRLGTPLPSSPDNAIKLKAEAIIAAQVDDPKLSVAALCRALGVSRASLYRLFADDGGVQKRIRHIRLHAARGALEESDTQIGHIGERFGFGEPAYFSRIFRAEFGITPSAYRAVFRQELGSTRI